MVPGVLIIGAQKAGTTSLYHYLTAHPLVFPAAHKEPRFFKERYSRGLNWYRVHFPLRTQRLLRPGALTLEATTGYLDYPHAPQRVAETLPEVKLVALLRDPVERAWSHYHHSLRLGRETLPFEVALEQEEARLGEYYRRVQSDPDYHDPAVGAHSYLARGRYAEGLERWLQVFGRERLLILKSEDLYADPESTVQTTLDFLGLPPLTDVSYRPFNEGKNKEDMDPQTRAQLCAYFKPHNEKLYELLGRDFGW